MPPEQELTLPFVTRAMLKYDHGTSFGLRVLINDRINHRIKVSGTTREGLFTFNIDPVISDGTLETFNLQIPDIPMFVTVVGTIDTHNRGNTYVQLLLTANDDPILKLCSGYVSFFASLSWPLVQAENNETEGGAGEGKLGVVPAAGAEAVLPVPSNEKWEILAVTYTLVTDANAANRIVGIEFDLGGAGTGFNAFAKTTQAASLTRHYTFAQFAGMLADTDGVHVMAPMPGGMVLGSAGELRSSIRNIQVGDQLTAIEAIIKRSMVPF